MQSERLAKVPAVTLGFWVIKILATTLGETGGDALSMTLALGYLLSTAIFGLLFLTVAAWQIRGESFHALRYWATIIATTTVGTTLADFADRSLGIGYAGGSVVLLALVLASLYGWHRSEGRIDVASVTTPRAESWYWLTILFSQTLGTALGDWTADSAGLGYTGAALIFSTMLAAIAAAYRWTALSRTALFWAAFVLTRPLGAVVGDFLDKPVEHGGLALGRFAASAALLLLIALCLWLMPQRAAREAH
jgi:uncharacterized membrane-anchored protein